MPFRRRKKKPEEEFERLRVPRRGEILGVAEQMSGFDHLRVRCKDGHTRICRIPGKIRKRLWIRENDVVIVRPWAVQSEEKGDIVYRYTRTQKGWLMRRGLWS
ncbi:MAG: translation initiation factor IF-1A [Hadesarchaea archaeon DG-33-1]|nr:MAG: translation initiation factor IF-1A [Hadesarchaea archaeon DG-33-1]